MDVAIGNVETTRLDLILLKIVLALVVDDPSANIVVITEGNSLCFLTLITVVLSSEIIRFSTMFELSYHCI